eukprot:17747-Heterococcus_DN1.PRE.2
MQKNCSVQSEGTDGKNESNADSHSLSASEGGNCTANLISPLFGKQAQPNRACSRIVIGMLGVYKTQPG